MNSKNLKTLRKAIRLVGAQLPARQLDQPTVFRMIPGYRAGLNLDGTLKMIPFEFPLPSRNVVQTQRGVYRAMKKDALKVAL